MRLANPFDAGIDTIFAALALSKRTQAEFAHSLGISQKHLSMIRHGHNAPTFALARRMWDEAMNGLDAEGVEALVDMVFATYGQTVAETSVP